MKWVILSICVLLGCRIFAQDKVTYVGTMGDTGKIEMEISTRNNKDYTGRYRFVGTREWVLLRGAMYIDNRNNIAQNLVLYEFMDGRDTAVFDLYQDGNRLSGTWQRTKSSPIFPVNLMQGKAEQSNPFDGYYHADKNELTVKTISDNTIEVFVILSKTEKCTDVILQGMLYKSGDQWKGSIPEQSGKGDATVIISFGIDQASMEIIPALLPDAKCTMGKEPYVRQLSKEYR